jgi:hypothetical protein
MNKKQQIYIKAALAALDEKNIPAPDLTSHARQTKTLEIFNGQQIDPKDYDYWLSVYTGTQGQLISLQGQKLPSETIVQIKPAGV